MSCALKPFEAGGPIVRCPTVWSCQVCSGKHTELDILYPFIGASEKALDQSLNRDALTRNGPSYIDHQPRKHTMGLPTGQTVGTFSQLKFLLPK